MVWGKWFKFSFLYVLYSVVQHNLLKRLSFPPLKLPWHLHWKLIAVNMRFISGFFRSISLVCVVILIQVSHCPNDCSFLINTFKIRRYKSFSPVLFQNYFDYSRFFEFPYKFKNQLVNFWGGGRRKACWDFDRDYVESVAQLGEFLTSS